jgi:hypothetical protein
MRSFSDGDSITIEPWRAAAFPVLRDLVVDRRAFDRIIQAGGFVSVPTGSAPDGNAILIPKGDAERAMDAAACSGCGACAAGALHPLRYSSRRRSARWGYSQGQAERDARALQMVAQMDASGSARARTTAVRVACPQGSPWRRSRMNRDYISDDPRDGQGRRAPAGWDFLRSFFPSCGTFVVVLALAFPPARAAAKQGKAATRPWGRLRFRYRGFGPQGSFGDRRPGGFIHSRSLCVEKVFRRMLRRHGEANGADGGARLWIRL